jgi:deoxyribodipyrimidine photolyase-related protein
MNGGSIATARVRTALAITTGMADTEHFYSARDEAATIFGQRGSWVLGISIAICASVRIMVSETGKPTGGQLELDLR